jgi:hypothetical protein
MRTSSGRSRRVTQSVHTLHQPTSRPERIIWRQRERVDSPGLHLPITFLVCRTCSKRLVPIKRVQTMSYSFDKTMQSKRCYKDETSLQTNQRSNRSHTLIIPGINRQIHPPFSSVPSIILLPSRLRLLGLRLLLRLLLLPPQPLPGLPSYPLPLRPHPHPFTIILDRRQRLMSSRFV